jgi:hypothetical protein
LSQYTRSHSSGAPAGTGKASKTAAYYNNQPDVLPSGRQQAERTQGIMELLLALGGFVALFTMWVVAPKFLVKKSE